MDDFDLVIVGAGIAGLTAGMTGARLGLRTVIVDEMGPGGQILNIEKIENYPGIPQAIAGYELGPALQEQAEAAGAEFRMDTVAALQSSGGSWLVSGAQEELRARTVILAMGSSFKELGIPGEAAFQGKGISHCASCDAHFFSGKDICVVGGGDSAVDEATVMTEHASRVLMIHRGSAFRAQKVSVDGLLARPNVEVLAETEVLEILGDASVSGVRVRTAAGGDQVLPVSGAFIFVGLQPNSAFLKGIVDMDPAGHVAVGLGMATSAPGVFAAGDIRQGSAALLPAVAGDGATAATSAFRYLAALGS